MILIFGLKNIAVLLEDIFDIQEKVSRSIFDALKLKLTPEENKRISEKPISNIVAYEYYLQAKREAWSFNLENLDHALQLTNQALDNIGENALLYATRAIIYWQYHNAAAGQKPAFVFSRPGSSLQSVSFLKSPTGNSLNGRSGSSTHGATKKSKHYKIFFVILECL